MPRVSSKVSKTTKDVKTTKTKKSDTKTNKSEKIDSKTNKVVKSATKTTKTNKTSNSTKTTKSTKTKKSSSSKKTSKATSSKKSVKKEHLDKKIENAQIIEYYDLPYRYNETIVKILYQTPNTLFIYWDISDKDKKKYIKEYGEYFFNNTKPVLIVTNETLNYSFEVDINDFANSWYLKVNDANCYYKVELGRKPINEHVSIPNNYLYISTSNNIESPNDHILFEHLGNIVFFKDVKTNITFEKNITSLSLIKKLGNVSNFYKKVFKDEDINFDKFTFKNISSSKN